MQAQIQLLPQRNPKQVAKFKNAETCQFYTNYYEINIDQKIINIYQYVLETDIPADSTSIIHRSIKAVSKQLREKIGLICSSGKIIWGTKKVNTLITLHSKFEHNGQPMTHQLDLKLVKQLQIYELLNSPETAPKILQFLNASLKEKLRQKHMVELGRGKYYKEKDYEQNHIKQAGLKVWRGFKFSLCVITAKLYVQVDMCSRVLQAKNFLQTMNGHSRDEILREHKGATVVTKYGKHKYYKIEDIDVKLSPLSEFFHEKNNIKISYEKYYKDNYGLTVTNKKQALIFTTLRIQKEINKKGELVEKPITGYLIPEFVMLTGMTDEQVANRDTMKELAVYTKVEPQERVHLIEQCNELVNNTDGGIFSIGKSKRSRGYILAQPQVEISKQNFKRARDGSLMLKDRLKEPATFADWTFVYSVGKEPKRDDGDADYAYDTMKKAAQTFGIKFQNPGFIVVEQRGVQAWKKLIENDAKKNGKPQIIVLFLAPFEEKFYGQLKRFITNEIKTSSQFIRKRTINMKDKKALSCASKVVLQMNAKVGKPLWEVQKSHPYFKDKKVMYGSLSVSGGKKGYTVAFVGTTNSSGTTIYSDCKLGIKKKQQLQPEMLTSMFVNWAKNFYMANKQAPDTIILYREGLSQAQLKKQITNQIQALDSMIQKISAKVNLKNYKPEVVYIMVTKKINSRFFMPIEKGHQPKFPPELRNPISGSVIVQELSINDAYDFQLVPQNVTQGTCTPTLYTIAYTNALIPQEALIEFTFEQCFNYFNWQGAVRVPGCLQYADKLSKLVGEHIQEDIVADAELQKKYHFL